MKTSTFLKGFLAIICFAAFMAITFIPHETLVAYCSDVLGAPDALTSLIMGNHADGIQYAMAAPVVTVFSKEVEEKLGPDNSFYLNSVDESSLIVGKTVRRNVAGDDPEGQTDVTQFPIQVEETEEDSNDYNIALHNTKPQRIADIDEIILNFSRRQVITNAHSRVLERKIAEEFIYNWSPAAEARIINASGAAGLPALKQWGATGTRLTVTVNDWIDACTKITQDEAWEEGNMYALVDAHQIGVIKKLDGFFKYDNTGIMGQRESGVVGQLNGVKIKMRGRGAFYSSAGNRKKLTSAIATTDNAGILIWNAGSVYRGIGKLKTYWNPDQGQYLGGTLNFAKRAGGNTRKDGLGIVCLREVNG